MLAHPETYEIMTPESVGVDKTNIVLGKHSGRAALAARLIDMGYQLESDQLNEIFTDFKVLADKKKEIADSDLAILVHGEFAEANQTWSLEKYELGSGDSKQAFAALTLKNHKTNEILAAKADGSGMVDAAYNCIKQLCGEHGTLTEFKMDAVTSGIDAQAVVNVRLAQTDGRVVTGRAGDTDIVKAAILAYLESVNKSL
jgi:2-isopropylmalate synthase